MSPRSKAWTVFVALFTAFFSVRRPISPSAPLNPSIGNVAPHGDTNTRDGLGITAQRQRAGGQVMGMQKLSTLHKSAIVAACLAGLGVWVSATASEPVATPLRPNATPTAPSGEQVALSEPAAPALRPFELTCQTANATSEKRKDSAQVRAAAQRSLDFLVKETIAWQEQYNCMGCHVQGVTGEALAFGFARQYDVGQNDMKTVFAGNLDINGGARTDTGHATGMLRLPSRTFAGAAIARYDEFVGDDYRDDLLSVAHDILEFQEQDGSLRDVYPRGPVSMGDAHQTYQAILTWKQAYARSADDRWLTAVAQGEKHLQSLVDTWSGSPPDDLQHLNYALLGLLSAGVGAGESYVLDLQSTILQAQNKDGGWGYSLSPNNASTPLATGQTLYTLRMLGMNDADPAIKAGIGWLIETQQKNGGWSDSGAGKAEAMWAVLGLVATDVLSINVSGVHHGQHVGAGVAIAAKASDNSGASVAKVEVVVDDITVWGECAGSTSYTLAPKGLEPGPHVVELVATNTVGKVAARRFVVYAGDTYLTQLGTTFDDGGTMFTARNIAPADLTHTIEITVRRADPETGLGVGEPIFTKSQAGKQGAASFFWDGSTAKGEQAERGDYYATLTFRDAAGKARQQEGLPFVHDTLEAQNANYGQVAGQLRFDDDQSAENAVVELVDEEGNVVQSVRSTNAGNYRFKNVKASSAAKGRKYKVRVNKKGFAADEMEIAPASGVESSVDMKLH